MNIVPVILAGGIGERFWPASRSTRPKQLLPLVSDRLMIEETFDRVLPLCSNGVKPLIITSEKIAQHIKDALAQTVDYDIIAEPMGKNTAPAVAAAAAWCKTHYTDDTVMLVVSADHAIKPTEAFVAAAQYGVEIATREDTLVVFGITPTRPETGYGYVQLGEKIGTASSGVRSFVAHCFVEKPDQETAQRYLDSGSYLWNSGMFIWRTDTIVDQFEKYMPDLYADFIRLIDEKCSIEALNRFYTECTKESIDFGIMEKADSVSVIEGSFDWDDIGAWESMIRVHGTDAQGNCVSGVLPYLADCHNTIIANRGSGAVAVIGVENLLVVTVDDTTLVISRDKLPELKSHLESMKQNAYFPDDLF